MIDSSYIDTAAGARIGTVLRGHQDLPGSVNKILVVRRIVVPIAQDKTCFDRQVPEQGGSGSIVGCVAWREVRRLLVEE